MHESIQKLYAELAKELGVDTIPADANGIVQLTIGENSTLVLVPEAADRLMVLSPVCTLPAQLDRGRVQWLLHRNFHNSELAPFRIACDDAGTVVIWGRIPVEGMSGENLAGWLDAVGAEGDLIRGELEIDDTPDDDTAA
jgi:Tir chaperone protein (CesT) family